MSERYPAKAPTAVSISYYLSAYMRARLLEDGVLHSFASSYVYDAEEHYAEVMGGDARITMTIDLDRRRQQWRRLPE